MSKVSEITKKLVGEKFETLEDYIRVRQANYIRPENSITGFVKGTYGNETRTEFDELVKTMSNELTITNIRSVLNSADAIFLSRFAKILKKVKGKYFYYINPFQSIVTLIYIDKELNEFNSLEECMNMIVNGTCITFSYNLETKGIVNINTYYMSCPNISLAYLLGTIDEYTQITKTQFNRVLKALTIDNNTYTSEDRQTIFTNVMDILKVENKDFMLTD
jgi:hypothetical protein